MTWTLIVAQIVIGSWSIQDRTTSEKAFNYCQQFKRMFSLVQSQCVLQVDI